MRVAFHRLGEIPEGKLLYVVTVARYQDKWLMVRHRNRDTWEFPGGHIEPGEAPEPAARRELWEETGAVDADMKSICVYSVTNADATTYGLLCFAIINRLDPIPQCSEMSERLQTDRLPEALTYPLIQGELFSYVQGWLNAQSNAGELWDVYDENRNLTGRLHRRGEPLGEGEYHLVVHVWMQNSRGEFLLTKRSPNKGFPNTWESTGGSALAGDDSLTAALREVKEETGLSLDPDKGGLLFSMRKGDFFRDVWLFRQDFDLGAVVLQPGETVDKMYADAETIQNMWDNGEFVPCDYLPALFEKAGI